MAVPDHRLGRVAALERREVLVLDRVEEAIAQRERLRVLPHASLPRPRAAPGPRRELARVHVLVDARDLAVLAQPDDADPERARWPSCCTPRERVLDHEAALEGVDRAVVVGAPTLSGVALRQRGEVLGARRLATEDVVPDDAVGRVDLGQLVDPAVLVGVEEAVAELADLAVGHDAGLAAARRRNLLESRYSSMRVIRPSLHCATMQAAERGAPPVVLHHVHRVADEEAGLEGVDRAGRRSVRRRAARSRRAASRGSARASSPRRSG